MKIISSKEKPCDGALDQGDDLWLVVDEVRAAEELAEVVDAVELDAAATAAAVKPRLDLDPDHPLYGKRALRRVPAGSRDIVVTDAGELTTDLSKIGVHIDPEPVRPDPGPVEPGPGDVGEVEVIR